jgi:hypothetical protein
VRGFAVTMMLGIAQRAAREFHAQLDRMVRENELADLHRDMETLGGAERPAIKAGEKAADIWPDKPAKARQKDTDARWTMKFSKAKPRRRRQAADRHRDPGLRLQVAHLHRPPPRRSSAAQRSPTRRPMTARGCARG